MMVPPALLRPCRSIRRRLVRKARRMPILGDRLLRRLHIQRYKAAMGEAPRLTPPVTYSEHLLHRIIYDRDPRLKIVSDKLAVRTLIRDRVGESFLVPLLGSWEDPDDIPWATLPERFVLKPNHGSGMVAIVSDATRLQRAEIEAEMRRWLRLDYFDVACEWGYRKLPRRLMAEPLLLGPDGHPPTEAQVMTFHGRPVMIRILTGKKGRDTRHGNWFDIDGNELSLQSRNIPVGTYSLARSMAHALAEIAGRAASGFDHLRVDFYLTDQGLKIGELTAYHASAIVEWNEPRFNELLGRCWSDPAEAAASRSQAALRSVRREVPIADAPRASRLNALHQANVESRAKEIVTSKESAILLR